MNDRPQCIFLDANVCIIGAAIPDSDEAAILNWAGFDATEVPEIEVVVSDSLFRQIRAVARRLRSKDWAGEILMRIWRHMNVRFVTINPQEGTELEEVGAIPREDVDIFLAANEDVERLLDEVVKITGEPRQRLALRAGARADEVRLFTFLQDEVWPQIPAELLGTHLSKQDEEDILGYGELGT